MHFRPANDDDVKWVRNNLRASTLRDFEGADEDFDEMWHDSLFRPGTKRVAFVNDAGECVALLRVFPVESDFRPNTTFVGFYGTPGIDEQPLGFLRVLQKWQEWFFTNHDCDEIWSWVSDGNQTSYKMLTKFLHWKLDYTEPPNEHYSEANHLLYCQRDYLEK
jgi:hypothetical protein